MPAVQVTAPQPQFVMPQRTGLNRVEALNLLLGAMANRTAAPVVQTVPAEDDDDNNLLMFLVLAKQLQPQTQPVVQSSSDQETLRQIVLLLLANRLNNP